MPGYAVDTVPEQSMSALHSPPFQGADLKFGAVYAVGIETAAARLPMLLAPLQAALRSGRPCVLITRLTPEEAPFADVLAHARQMVEATGGAGAAHLQVFTAVGDYAVNLFLHGVDRYLQELDQFEIAPGSLLLIDEADDLYTPHDHVALVQQARTYRAWCERHQHTMVQLHLRTSAHRPLMEGNQAAAHYLSGLARVTSHPEGLRMAIDFWESPAGVQTGLVMPLDPLMTPSRRLPAMNGVAAGFTAAAAPQPGSVAAALPSVWYVGQPDADLGDWRRQFKVRTAASLTEVLPWRRDDESDSLSIVVTLASLDEFAGFVEQLAQLRANAGDRARIVVRESRYRLREHTQKRLLLRAGVDSVLPPSQSLKDLAPLLLQPRLEPAVEVTDADGDASEPLALEAQSTDEEGWLCRSAFVDEAERRMQRSMLRQVPCALAEIDFEDLPAPDEVSAAKMEPQAGRTGDLTTALPGARFFFLQGCRGRDVMSVVTRCMDDAAARRVQRIHLYTGESAIVDRLAQLRQEAASETLPASVPQDKSASNVVTMPATGRAAQSRGHVSMVVFATLVAALGWPLGDALAQGSPAVSAAASPAAVATSARAYEQANYAEAARLGLIELQREPRDHELRLRVANSLAWTGQYGQAIQQYGLLADTPLAPSASIGMANVHLWSGRPHLADPLFRRVLSLDPVNSDAQQGLASAQRQLRPRTTVRGAWLDDSSQVERSTALLAHRWRDAGLTQAFEVSGESVDESRSPGGPALRPRKLSFGYQNLALPFAPKLQLTSDSGVKSSVFANLGLQLAEGAVTVELGRVNWGEIAFDPRARRDGLAARRVGVAGRVDSSIGAFSGSGAYFAVSDGNRVQEFNAQYTPAWQPFPAATGVRAFVGAYGRKAERRDPRYWSPASGYYVGQIGLSLNRSAADWDLSAEVKRSQRIGGEGAPGWTVGLGGTRWLSRDWAVRIEGFHIETRRDDSAYRSKSIAVSIDRVW